jgi:hypothetical protein
MSSSIISTVSKAFCWVYPEAANVFKKIKALTGQTNDEIVNLAIKEIYNSIYYGQVNKSIERIRVKLSEEAARTEMACPSQEFGSARNHWQKSSDHIFATNFVARYL